MRCQLLVSLVTLFLAGISTLPATAQTSVGFADPQALSNLLDYRLPPWGYRTWDADFGLGGNGYDSRVDGGLIIYNNFSTNLGTDFTFHRESEQQILNVTAGLSGRYQHTHYGSVDSESSRHRLSGDYSIGGTMDHYLGDGPFSLLAGVHEQRSYDENINSSREGDTTTDNDQYSRSTSHTIRLGAGVGRLRNVVPLLRAERLSERLATLGHQRLSSAQVREVAEILAQEYGYRRVFDRRDRHFWSDVLEPMLAGVPPLTPYEIFYLTDVLKEDVGLREQGWQLSAEFEYRDGHADSPIGASDRRSRIPLLRLVWSHNRSLTQQIFLAGTWRYSFSNQNEEASEYASLDAAVGHLWNLTDRHLLESRLSYSGDSSIEDENRIRRGVFQVTLTTYIEDRLSLDTNLGTSYASRTYPEGDAHGWSWNFGVQLRYHLDRNLF